MLPNAEEVNYWKTSRSSADSWIDKAVSVVEGFGATDIQHGFGQRDGTGAFVLMFRIDDERFKIAWPILPTKSPKDMPAARVQAATLLYHDAKARSLSASILGVRQAFIGYLLLPDGRTVSELAAPEISEHIQPAGFLTDNRKK